jgi:hypothetical protein
VGAKLVGAAFMYWRHLPDRPFRLLTHMALTCRDGAEVPTYYAGRAAMAQSLGLGDDESGRVAVKRALRVLTASGAVSVAYHGHAGKRSEYSLHVLDQLTKGGTQMTPKGGTQMTPKPPERGNTSVGKGGTPVTPLGLELQEEHCEENTRKNSSSTEGEYRGPRVESEKKVFPTADEILARAAAKRAAS